MPDVVRILDIACVTVLIGAGTAFGYVVELLVRQADVVHELVNSAAR